MNDTLPTLKARLNELAAELGRDLSIIAAEILVMAEWIDAEGNKGYSTKRIPSGFAKDFLTNDYRDLWDGILFHKADNDDDAFSGWMVRRNPPYMQIWCLRYGDTNPQRRDEYLSSIKRFEEQKAREAAEAAKPKRQAEEFVQGKFADFSTRQIGQRYAVAEILSARYEKRHWEHYDGSEWQDRLDRWIGNLWLEQSRLFGGELSYRAATGDVEAGAILKAGYKYYFPAATIANVIDGSLEPEDAELLDPIPPLPRVVHVRSREWINCHESERVYVGRKMKEFPASIWANPHKVGSEGNEVACLAFERDLLRNPDLLAKLPDLRGKRLIGCWCKAKVSFEESKACHGDVLLKYLAMSDEQINDLVEQALDRQEREA